VFYGTDLVDYIHQEFGGSKLGIDANPHVTTSG
jgi:hypothetical protein